ncbi:hypothetical protein J2S13_003138 [Oikeobacillus pervagus]|uniref:Uncharacterized protein n=1 Tax=Oikeobacillus pervagus TaxID=1325931 RepID=A0AAJ1T0Y1_9BACI|nr:hypothetical protein [Oikeobacillus pervagus]MDQ0216664.1 hypothetical protein [Oikeobacillus pervagus]
MIMWFTVIVMMILLGAIGIFLVQALKGAMDSNDSVKVDKFPNDQSM